MGPLEPTTTHVRRPATKPPQISTQNCAVLHRNTISLVNVRRAGGGVEGDMEFAKIESTLRWDRRTAIEVNSRPSARCALIDSDSSATPIQIGGDISSNDTAR